MLEVHAILHKQRCYENMTEKTGTLSDAYLGVQSKSTISDNCADVVFLYQNYGDFSGDIEYLYTEIVNRLRIKGLIN